MGWSCSAAAARTIQALSAFAEASGFDGSNHVSRNAFFETSSIEHDDGAITGEVHVIDSRLMTSPAGAARIDANGRIAAMPRLDFQAFVTWLDRQPRWASVKSVNMLKPVEQGRLWSGDRAPRAAAPRG